MTASTVPLDPGPDVLGMFSGTVLIVAPHMDDEVLACGGLVARLPDKRKIHMVFATDGMKSPAPVVPWRDTITADLGQLRCAESRDAAALLGVPQDNLRFLLLPEAELSGHATELARGLREQITEIDPDHILMPFRYDRHPDHLAVNRALVEMKRNGATRASLIEYFVYYRSRLLLQRDVRAYIKAEHLIRLDIAPVAAIKRAALACFRTQTTHFYPWQTRPILRPELLDQECIGPELFLRYDPRFPGTRVFSGNASWIRVAHWLEPFLLRWKYVLKSAWTRGSGYHG